MSQGYVIFEKKGTRYAYDLRNRIRWEGTSGKMSFFLMKEDEVVIDQESGTQSDQSIRFIDYEHIDCLCSWLEGADLEVILRRGERYYKNKAESDPNFQISKILKDIYEILKENK